MGVILHIIPAKSLALRTPTDSIPFLTICTFHDASTRSKSLSTERPFYENRCPCDAQPLHLRHATATPPTWDRYRITPQSFTTPLPLLSLFLVLNTSQNLSVSSPAPVTTVPPSGLMERYSTLYV